jgi:predicted phage tail protein
VESAFWNASGEAQVLLNRRFRELDILEVVDDLLESAAELARILAASSLIGGAIGGVLGSVPGAAVGGVLGLKAGGWVLGMYGLATLAEHFVEGMPDIAWGYQQGVKQAWNAPYLDHSRNGRVEIDSFAMSSATSSIARGHEATTLLLLGAIVAYLTRNGGGAAGLLQKMRSTARGERLAAWVAKHEQALKQHPALKVPEPALAVPSGPMRHEVAAPRPGNGREAGTHPRRARRMARVEVPCFSAKRMPYSKIPEFDRQLVGQEKGLNALTIHEYVTGRAAFAAGDVKRDPQKARMARMEYAEKMQEQHSEELRAIGVPYGDAIRLAKIRTGEKMNALAALHNPDLIGGGKDIISDFGDRQVNSSIGPQWKSRARHIDDAVQIHLNSGDAGDLLEMKNERMSTSLTRCI